MFDVRCSPPPLRLGGKSFFKESALRGRIALPQIEDTGGPPMPLFEEVPSSFSSTSMFTPFPPTTPSALPISPA
jgi:hypothetical protein